jgi:hypothetical protein
VAVTDELNSEAVVEDLSILTHDIPDEAIEAAASVDDMRVFTLAFCSQDWNYCYPL